MEATWGEREVRRLLNALRRPDIAQVDPLGRLLCEILGVPTPVEAMTRLINATFAGQGYAGARLGQLLLKCDIEGALSQAGVAFEMGLSLRQFFRYRARAIKLVSDRIRLLLGEPGQAPDALRTLAELVGETSPGTAMAIYDLTEGRHDAQQMIQRMRARVQAGGEIPNAWIEECAEPWKTLATAIQARAYELKGDSDAARACVERVRARVGEEHPLRSRVESELFAIDVLRAKYTHNAAQLYRIGRAMRAAASEDRTQQLTPALLVEAEACLRLGSLADASEMIRYIHRMARNNRDVRSMALGTLLSAHQALLCGNFAVADELATGALFALREQRTDAAFCEMTIGRARLPLGKRWHAPADVVSRPEGAWDRMALEIIETRYVMRDAKFGEAGSRAERLYSASMAQGYTGLIAHCAAIVAACAGMQGEEAREQQHYVEAWKHITRSGDRLAGCDVFTGPAARPKDLGPLRIDELFCEAIVQRIRQLAPDVLVSYDLCAEAIAFAGGSSAHRDAAESLAALCGDEVFAVLGNDLALALPFERRERWLQRWNEPARKKDACDESQASSRVDSLSA
jgi:hypothetical protein